SAARCMTLDYHNPRPEPPTVEERWRQFVLLRRMMTWGYVGMFLVIAPLFLLFAVLNPSPNSGWLTFGIIVVGFGGLVGWATAMAGTIGCTFWRCPSCRGFNSLNWWSNWPWRKSCAHCGWRHDSIVGG